MPWNLLSFHERIVNEYKKNISQLKIEEEFRSFIFLDVYHSEMQPETLLLEEEAKHQFCAILHFFLSSVKIRKEKGCLCKKSWSKGPWDDFLLLIPAI